MDIPFGMDWSRTDVQTSKQIVSKIFIKKISIYAEFFFMDQPHLPKTSPSQMNSRHGQATSCNMKLTKSHRRPGVPTKTGGRLISSTRFCFCSESPPTMVPHRIKVLEDISVVACINLENSMDTCIASSRVGHRINAVRGYCVIGSFNSSASVRRACRIGSR